MYNVVERRFTVPWDYDDPFVMEFLWEKTVYSTHDLDHAVKVCQDLIESNRIGLFDCEQSFFQVKNKSDIVYP